MSNPLVLYYNPMGVPSRNVLFVIRELGLEAELKLIDPREGQTRTPEFLAMNPQHTIPTLDDNGFYLWESRAIMIYLIESKTQGHDLLPKTPKERALINRMLQYEMNKVFPNTMGVMFELWPMKEKIISEEMKQKIREQFEELENFLEGTFFAGDHLTLADISIFTIVSNMKQFGFDISKYSRVSAWFERCKVLKGFEEDAKFLETVGDMFRGLVKQGF